MKIKFNLLQILTMNSLNVKHQGKSSIGISPASLHAVPQHNRITNAEMKLDKVMNSNKEQ